MSDPDDTPEIPPEELLAALEEFKGKPERMSNTDGIAAMTQRIAYLEDLLKAPAEGGAPMPPAMRANTLKELNDARLRLRGYQAGHDGRN